MAAKRKLEFEDYSQVAEEAGSADIHGVVTSLSPLKRSKKGNNYYHGQLCDGKQSLRFVGFASNQQKMLEEFLEGRKSVQISNCQSPTEIQISLRCWSKEPPRFVLQRRNLMFKDGISAD